MITLFSLTYALAAPCTVGASGMECPEQFILDNVAEACHYRVVYQLDIGPLPDYDTTVPYTIDNSGAEVNYDRLAYMYELDGDWVWASMDDFASGLLDETGIPRVSVDPFVQQTTVNNMNVDSNHVGVTTGQGISTGNVEFWGYNYSPSGGLPIGGNNNAYDFNDSPAFVSDHGSFQIHNYGLGETLFGFNLYNRGQNCQTGIGNAPASHTDWTGGGGFCSDHSNRRLTVLARVEGDNSCDAAPACNEGPDEFACAVVAHAQATDVRITESSGKKALRPSTIYNQFVAIGDILADDQCELGGTPWAGTYSKGQLSGATGDRETITGSYGGNQFFGAIDDGVAGAEFGDGYSLYNSSMKAIADVDGGGFAVGRFARAAGRNGVFIMAESGQCDYFSAFDGYFNGALPDVN